MRLLRSLAGMFRRSGPVAPKQVPICLDSDAGREQLIRSCADTVAAGLKLQGAPAESFFVGVFVRGKLLIETRWREDRHEKLFGNDAAQAIGNGFLGFLRERLGLANDDGQPGGAA